MAETKITYADDAALDVSAWESLGSGLSATSGAIINTTNLYVDILVGGEVAFSATTIAAGESFDIYVAALYDKDATGGYTGGLDDGFVADSAMTVDTHFVRGNLIFLTSIGPEITTPDTTQDYNWGPIGIAQCFGGILPQNVILLGHNNTGSDLTTGNTGNIVGITYTSA